MCNASVSAKTSAYKIQKKQQRLRREDWTLTNVQEDGLEFGGLEGCRFECLARYRHKEFNKWSSPTSCSLSWFATKTSTRTSKLDQSGNFFFFCIWQKMDLSYETDVKSQFWDVNLNRLIFKSSWLKELMLLLGYTWITAQSNGKTTGRPPGEQSETVERGLWVKTLFFPSV